MKLLRQRNAVKSLTAASFILPSMIGFLVFYVSPTIQGFFLSFTDWDLLSKSNFIGLKNYSEIFTDKEFWNSLKVTLAYVLWNIPIQTALALCIALIMDRVATSMVMRGILLIPWILSNVVVALLWLWMLDSSIGIVNGILGLTGGQAGQLPHHDATRAAVDGGHKYLAAYGLYRAAGLCRTSGRAQRA